MQHSRKVLSNMTLSELKPITLFLYCIVLFCCSCYVLCDTTVAKDFSVFFIFISVSGLAISVFVSQNFPRKNPLVSSTRCNSQISYELFRLYELFETCINDDLTFLKQDLDQTKILINNAGNSLTDNFQRISAIVSQQQQLITSLIETSIDKYNQNEINQIELSWVLINKGSSQCISALQFEDIVTQIINNSQTKVDEISRYLTEFKTILKNQQDNSSFYVDAVCQLKILIGNIKEFQVSRCHQNRMEFVQKDFSAGDHELF